MRRNAPAGATVKVFDNAGHMSQMEKANDVNALLKQHLAGVRGGRDVVCAASAVLRYHICFRQALDHALPTDRFRRLPANPSMPRSASRACAAGDAVGACLGGARSLVCRAVISVTPLDDARAEFARRGCPVWLRLSGGGLVPQGPGVLNLSLAYPVHAPMGALSETVYVHLCEILADTLNRSAC